MEFKFHHLFSALRFVMHRRLQLPKTDCINSSANCSILRQMRARVLQRSTPFSHIFQWRRFCSSCIELLLVLPSFSSSLPIASKLVSLGENLWLAIKIIGPITTTLRCQLQFCSNRVVTIMSRGERKGGVGGWMVDKETWLIKLDAGNSN